MCYSAQVEASYKKYVRAWGAGISIAEFFRLYWNGARNSRIKTPKAMDAAFSDPQTPEEREVKWQIDERNAIHVTNLEQDLFKQKKRLADAERTLKTKTTKKALEDQRIAGEKIEWTLGKLADIRRTELNSEDSRIFPGWFAPVIVADNGKRLVKPMRYQCRLAGSPAFNDVKFPGTYNARRDNLEGFWRRQFGYSHGIMVASAFYENVALHDMQHRELAPGEKEQNVILEFRRSRRRRCWSRVYGHIGSTVTKSCYRSPRSRTTRLQRSPRPVTTVASFRSSQRMSIRGSTRIQRTWLRCIRFLTTGRGRTTSIGWLRKDSTASCQTWHES